MLLLGNKYQAVLHQNKLKGLDVKDSKQLINKFISNYKDSGKVISDEQKEAIYQISNGIPIIIIHCLGQIYEFNASFDSVCCKLKDSSSEIIKFSFLEVFKLLEKNQTQLKLIILLDIVKMPIMVRQASEILEIAEGEINACLPILINFQCVITFSQGIEEKYLINDEVRLFTQSLIHKYSQIQMT